MNQPSEPVPPELQPPELRPPDHLPSEYLEEGQPQVRVPGPVAAVERVLIIIAGMILMACMTMTTIDVTGRYLLNRPLGFAYEVTELMMGIVVFVAMGSVTLRKEHITVTLFENVWGKGKVKAVRDVFIAFLTATTFGYFSYRMFLFVGRFYQYGDTTSVLQIHTWPFAAVGAAGAAFGTLAALALAVRSALSIFGK